MKTDPFAHPDLMAGRRLSMLFLEYPKIVEQHDLRSRERVDCLLFGRLKSKDAERPCLVLDIKRKSADGTDRFDSAHLFLKRQRSNLI